MLSLYAVLDFTLIVATRLLCISIFQTNMQDGVARVEGPVSELEDIDHAEVPISSLQ